MLACRRRTRSLRFLVVVEVGRMRERFDLGILAAKIWCLCEIEVVLIDCGVYSVSAKTAMLQVRLTEHLYALCLFHSKRSRRQKIVIDRNGGA